MSVSNLSFRKACLSSLLHDLRVVASCLSFHATNSFNPYSLKVREELQRIHSCVMFLYAECCDESFSYLNFHED